MMKFEREKKKKITNRFSQLRTFVLIIKFAGEGRERNPKINTHKLKKLVNRPMNLYE